MANGLFFNATVCWTLSEPSLQRLWKIQRKLSDICFLSGLWRKITQCKNTKKEALWMQNRPDVCSALHKLREILKVQFPAHCFCYFALLILFFSPALLYFSPFVSLRNNFSFRLHLPCIPPSPPHLHTLPHILQCEKSPRVFLLGFLRTGSPYLMKWLSC